MPAVPVGKVTRRVAKKGTYLQQENVINASIGDVRLLKFMVLSYLKNSFSYPSATHSTMYSLLQLLQCLFYFMAGKEEAGDINLIVY